MAWEKYRLVFRLESPLHIGYRKVGNLMQTRGYVPGKNLWAALVERLTRETVPSAVGEDYVRIGDKVNEQFRLPYLYPALDPAGTPIYHWQNDWFDYRFLSSYASSAIDYGSQSSSEGLLHETEFICSKARQLSGDAAPPQVYLMGDLFVQYNLDPELTNWQSALSRIQIGGERRAGWGRLSLEPLPERGVRIPNVPYVEAEENEHVLAHVYAQNEEVAGPVEPMVGWERNNSKDNSKKWRLSTATICYTPGAIVKRKTTFAIGQYGVWSPLEAKADGV